MPVENSKKKWTVHIGIHRGTITGRDSESPKECADLDECKHQVAAAERYCTSTGAHIWYAHAIDPEGKQHVLHEGVPYTS